MTQHQQIAIYLRATNQSFMPVGTSRAFPVFGCNKRFGEAANDTNQKEPPTRA